MKKTISYIIFTIFLSVAVSFAQPKVSTSSSSIDAQVKRCFANGDDVCIDLLITSTGSLSFLEINTHPANDRLPGCKFFDDEGKLYQSGSESSMLFEVDGTRSYWFPRIQLERDVPRKIRIIVKNVDEYASSFSSIRIPFSPNGSPYSTDEGTITIKNLPITR